MSNDSRQAPAVPGNRPRVLAYVRNFLPTRGGSAGVSRGWREAAARLVALPVTAAHRWDLGGDAAPFGIKLRRVVVTTVRLVRACGLGICGPADGDWAIQDCFSVISRGNLAG